ncbi:hypothetical protein NQZ68_002842 [Dissostichus eleginoides]|nr:hypothetical protein NQZ68_002842 [Dissostichus eleginoides]
MWPKVSSSQNDELTKNLKEEKTLLEKIDVLIEARPKKRTPRQQNLKCLGLPNPAQLCYMNSCLQSLLTLDGCDQTISSQEHFWSSSPEVALLRCGAGSTRVEEYTNLSLDMMPGGGNVEQLLKDYMMNLPKKNAHILLLSTECFKVTRSYKLEKVNDPVDLLRDLITACCYSFISTIHHMGSSTQRGHYNCDGVDQDVGLEDPTDCWFTYDDSRVRETSGDCVCDRRKETAYILSYRRQD